MFDTHFEVVLADTEEARDIHYRLRYRVFCSETGFEDPAAFPDGKECDEYDEHAVHFLIRDRSSHDWIATMRLVLGRYGDLPAEHICENLDKSLIAGIDHRHIGEISRLCMVSDFRRRRHERRLPYEVIDGKSAAEHWNKKERRKEPEILVGLLRALYEWTKNNDVRYCYFLISPALARIVGRLNLKMIKAGGSCEHRGTRIPYFADVKEGRRQLLAGPRHVAAMMLREPAYRLFSELSLKEKVA
ncbi:MAG TPA: PEP-CTERM/exosortase system-associated acyltransferase [Sedimenticola sp.]|nr:PEP-CTERM/exosortase system-associated acyltransferase [Sedimenticola sp.]